MPYHVGADGGVAATTYDTATDNGMLYVYVLNELVVPNPTAVGNPVVNVFVSSDDMHFNVPRTTVLNKVGFFVKPTDSFYIPSATYVDPLDPSEENMIDDVGGNVESDDLRTFFGQRPVSWRALFKRAYALNSPYADVTLGLAERTTIMSSFDASICCFPAYKGYNPNGPLLVPLPDGTNSPYEPARATILNWVAPMYCAWRGGFRVKCVSNAGLTAYDAASPAYTPVTARQQYTFQVERTDPSEPQVDSAVATISTDLVTKFSQFAEDAFNGIMLTPGSEQPVLEVEAPFLSNRRFNDPRKLPTNDGTPVDEGGYVYLDQKTSTITTNKGTVNYTSGVHNYGSTAPDFSLFWRISTYPIYDIELQYQN